MKIFFTLVLFIGLIGSAAAQRQCGTMDYKRSQPSVLLQSPQTLAAARDTTANEIITIPVVVHVLYNTDEQNISDEQIHSQITALNLDFRKQNYNIGNVPAQFAKVAGDAKINFTLAVTDPRGNSTNGIIRKQTSVQQWDADDAMKFSAARGDNGWDANNYLNIWICNLSGRSLGYASLPGTDLSKDGIVIQYTAFGTTGAVKAPFNKGRTLTHETGHWLGLMHIWGDNNCGDDKIGDTPPQQAYNNGCPSFPHLSSCSADANGDMFMNFMDFTNDDCMSMFTNGQKNKMRSLFAKGGSRNSLLVSPGNKPATGEAKPTAPVEIITNKATISFYPNPAKEKITFNKASIEDLNGQSVYIYNSLGRQVLATKVNTENPSVAVSNLSSGIYIVKIGAGKNTTTLKLVKD
ncbi:MAG: M43 family zinc metalloprotease [Ginsengibacter sp.]